MLPAVVRGVFGAGSGFGVGWRTGGGGGVGFLRGFLVLAELSFWRGVGHWAMIQWGFETCLIFPNFLVFSRSATRSATRIYHL